MEKRKRSEKFCVDLPRIDFFLGLIGWPCLVWPFAKKRCDTALYSIQPWGKNLYDETYTNPKLKRYKYFILQVRSFILALNPQSDHFLSPDRHMLYQAYPSRKMLKWIDRFHTSSNTGEKNSRTVPTAHPSSKAKKMRQVWSPLYDVSVFVQGVTYNNLER